MLQERLAVVSKEQEEKGAEVRGNYQMYISLHRRASVDLSVSASSYTSDSKQVG